MEFLNLIRNHPMNGIAFLLAGAAIAWSILTVRLLKSLHDRLLTGLVGATAVFQGMRLLMNAGMLLESSRNRLDDFVNLLVTGICLLSLWLLRGLAREHRTTKVALRLAEGNQAVPVLGNPLLGKPSDDYSKVVLDAAPMPMFAVGLDGNVNCWNRAAEKVLGWSRDEVLGQKLPNLVLYPGDPMAGGGGAIRLVRKDGAPLDSEIRSVPIRDARGAVNGILTIVSA